MRKPTRKTLTTQLDRAVSRLVRERNLGACEMCTRPATEVHHVIKRMNRRVRWDERNLVAVCSPCHSEIEGNLLAFSLWLKRRRPQDFEYLADYENTKPIKRTDYELRELLADLRAQLADALEEAA